MQWPKDLLSGLMEPAVEAAVVRWTVPAIRRQFVALQDDLALAGQSRRAPDDRDQSLNQVLGRGLAAQRHDDLERPIPRFCGQGLEVAFHGEIKTGDETLLGSDGSLADHGTAADRNDDRDDPRRDSGANPRRSAVGQNQEQSAQHRTRSDRTEQNDDKGHGRLDKRFS